MSPSSSKGKSPADVPFPSSIFSDDIASTGKGKARELPPSLPPLSFSPTEFEGQIIWPSSGLNSQIPGPSSYSSGFSSISQASSSSSSSSSPESYPPNDSSPTLRRFPSRARSLSNISIRSDGTTAASRIKLKLGGSSTLARKLLFRKQRTTSNPSSRPTSTFGLPSLGTASLNLSDTHDPSFLLPWHDGVKPDHLIDPFANLSISRDLQSVDSNLLVKGRSNSSPLPFTPYDIVPSSPHDFFVPIPIVIRNYFDTILPREIRLEILASLVSLHQAAFEKNVREANWTVKKASSSKNKYVGRDKGIRELIKFSRVSKSWQALVFDGQLWTKLDLCAFPKMPTCLVLRLVQTAGPFIKDLDLVGHTHLLSSTLIRITDDLSAKSTFSGLSAHTQLTTLNLQGCTAITTRALHYLLARCPALQTLCLKGLQIITNTTCQVISDHCHHLISLDLSRCLNVDGEGIRTWAASRGACSPLKELRLSGIRDVGERVMKTLGRATPYLEVLDLSYVEDLHNSAIEAFVACEEDERFEHCETVLLTSREAGRDPSDSTRYRRRVTRLRHLSMSSCGLLTDIACSHLAYTVPRLELLELAGIGSELRDDGLVHLLDTTPFLRRLDLEDASDITDAVLIALTPDANAQPPMTGHALEHLVVSYASMLTEEALRALMRACHRLRVLEADNTRLSGAALKEFVRLSRRRGHEDARVVAIDCRAVGEAAVREVAGSTRPRLGWRAYEARRLAFLDGLDREDVGGVGQDECDPTRVVLKSFYSWQTVDAVRAARRKAAAGGSSAKRNGSEESLQAGAGPGRARWWSAGGRSVADGHSHEREGCIIM